MNKGNLQEYIYMFFAIWLHIFSLVLIFTENSSAIILQSSFILILIPFYFQVKLNTRKIRSVNNGIFNLLIVFVFFSFFGVVHSLNLTSIFKLIDLIILFKVSKVIFEGDDKFLSRVSIYYSAIGILFVLFFVFYGYGHNNRSIVGLNPNYIGLISVTVCLSSLYNKNIPIRLLTYILSIVLVLMVSSRTSLLCILIITLIDSLYYGRYFFFGFRNVLFKFIVVFMYFALIYLVALDYLVDSFMIYDDYRGLGSGFSGRGYRWEIAVSEWTSKPIFGHGYGLSTSLLGFTVDNAYITALLETGIIGLSMYLGVLFSALINSYRLRIKPLFIFLIIYMVYGFFEKRYFNIGNSLSIIFVFVLFEICALSKSEKLIKNISMAINKD